MNQTAAWMRDLGSVFAIALDGGGSSTMYYKANGGVQGCPTATDFPCCISRAVQTITCLK